jgi:hypothetical protein
MVLARSPPRPRRGNRMGVVLMTDWQGLDGVTFITGVGSFTASATTAQVYRVDTSAGAVTANLPPAANCVAGVWHIIKNISGTNPVTVTPAAGESVNGAANNTLTTNNQRRQYYPGVPVGGPYTAPGWMSV